MAYVPGLGDSGSGAAGAGGMKNGREVGVADWSGGAVDCVVGGIAAADDASALEELSWNNPTPIPPAISRRTEATRGVRCRGGTAQNAAKSVARVLAMPTKTAAQSVMDPSHTLCEFNRFSLAVSELCTIYHINQIRAIIFAHSTSLSLGA
jgi:hypothetical protein